MPKSKTATKTGSTGTTPLITRQPQSMVLAATQAGIFLHDNDAWSQAYFNANDLHNLERELFG